MIYLLYFVHHNHLAKFANDLNSKHKNIKFSYEKETNNSLTFLDTLISRSKNGFKISIYHTPTFSGVYSNTTNIKLLGFYFVISNIFSCL